ncbi:TPA: hypothetical protein IU076_002593 [Enterococcus faecalis]|uniref:hypothetical protein n=1 Tax=Enterococcus faecalis TaxID=1351 RepID=UPI0019E0BA31|nr:hypothetical protein [Enterococcus faecalis]EGO8494381.1 hypothetical protein [Enterococcus faecalis]MDN3095771.1 hypothetical protein [Enterococcus faecalis]HAP5652603.1 hypothetical protein [Enterococcus faecalis]
MFIHFIKSVAIVAVFLVGYTHMVKQVNRRLQQENFNKIHKNKQISESEKLIWEKIEVLLKEEKLTYQEFKKLTELYKHNSIFDDSSDLKEVSFCLVEQIADCSNVDIEYFRHFAPAEDFEQYLINK